MTCPPHSWRTSPEYGEPVCSKCGTDADVDETPLACTRCKLLPAHAPLLLCDACVQRAELEAGTEDDRAYAIGDGWVA